MWSVQPDSEVKIFLYDFSCGFSYGFPSGRIETARPNGPNAAPQTPHIFIGVILLTCPNGGRMAAEWGPIRGRMEAEW